MQRIGIVGHRFIRDNIVLRYVRREITTILKDFCSLYPDLIALSAIAEGADTIFAETALELGMPLETIRPYQAYHSDFTTVSARNRYSELCAASCKEIVLSHTCRSDQAYKNAMNLIVTHSDLLVVVWDGCPATAICGTSNAVDDAVRLNKSWIHLNVVDLTVTQHFATEIIKMPYATAR